MNNNRNLLCADLFQLDEGKEGEERDISRVQLLRAGKFYHTEFGKFEFNEAVFKGLKKNFDDNVRKVDLAVDYFHKSFDEAAGWIKEVEISEDGDALFIVVDWTEEARKKILDKQVRYLSADINFNYIDDETDTEYGPTLNGAGLTNRPFIKGMDAILDEGEYNEFDQLRTAALELTDDEKAQLVQTLAEDFKMDNPKQSNKKKEVSMSEKDTNEDTAVKLAEASSKIAELEKDNTELREKAAIAEKEKQFTALLSEGKVVEAQREAYMRGDMGEVLKLSQPVNLDEDGHGEGADEGGDEDEDVDVQEKVMTLAEEKLKKDESLDQASAISLVLSENPELNKKYEEVA